jgi:hypothetical protein
MSSLPLSVTSWPAMIAESAAVWIVLLSLLAAGSMPARMTSRPSARRKLRASMISVTRPSPLRSERATRRDRGIDRCHQQQATKHQITKRHDGAARACEFDHFCQRLHPLMFA